MNTKKQNIILKMNEFGKARRPFVFIIDFDFKKPLFFDWEESRNHLFWKTPRYRNFLESKQTLSELLWDVKPVSYDRYQKAFNLVQQHLHNGDSYLLNLTMPSEVTSNYKLEAIFHASEAPYKIWMKDQFVCFSPEIFVQITNGEISSFPMKGTIDAAVDNAEFVLKNDKKELAEHNTIVDLIRNDLSTVAHNVQVKRFRYIDRIVSNKAELLQMSSQISGKLPDGYHEQLGNIINAMLPAGSISGAPKKKTVEIIKEAEQYDRGYYTGIFGVFDGNNLDSCVLIRFLEQNNDQLLFKSGGGITYMSDCETEYKELIKKVYVPVT